MGIEGHLDIHLQTTADTVARVDIGSSRPLQAARVFHRKTVSEALRLLPLLYSVCGVAQACAGVRACEQALDLRADPALEQRREALVRMETLREHLWRIALDWPAFIDEPAEPANIAALLPLQKQHREALSAGAELFLPAAGLPPITPLAAQATVLIDPIEQLLAEAVFGMPPTDWLALTHPSALQDWASAGTTVAARLIRRVIDQSWSGIGRCDIGPLPALDPDTLGSAMRQDEFIARPQWRGACHETSCLTRSDGPLLSALSARYGNGLLTRLVARLTELARCSQALRLEASNHAPRPEPQQAPQPAPPRGIGQVAAARGLLIHQVVISGQTITDYRILAPTEWNFHPLGVVARGLTALQGGPALIEQQARLLINAVDPCVAYRLTLT